MTRFERVIGILDQAIGGPTVNIGVHQAFWRGLTRDQFVAKKVFGVALVTLSNGAGSNLIKALKGEAPFGLDLPDAPADAQFSRMPAGMEPVPDSDIAFIQKWIDDGCPAQDEATAAEPKWRPTNAPEASSRTDDIWFVDREVGWAVNSNGQILHTSNGGASWDEQLHDEDVYFRCIGLASRTRGWAGTLTAGKRLFETRDGRHWTPVALPAGAPSAICGLSVVSDHVVFASGTNFPNRPPAMIKTVDGGQTWTAITMKPFADLLIDTFFTSPDEGWVVGGKTEQPSPTRENVKPVVLRTRDGGRTWINTVASLEPTLPRGEWGWKIQFLDARIGFVSLENFTDGAILRTSDGGATWTRHQVNDPQRNVNLEGVGFIDARHGWVGGWGDAQFVRQSSSETLDGGLTWRDANEIGKGLNRFRFFGNPVTVGYASGRTVYKYSSEPVPPLPRAVAPRLRMISAPEVIEAADTATIPVTVPPGAQRITVRIWDRFGDPIRLLVDEQQPAAGSRQLSWDRTDDSRQRRPPGVFIVRVTVDGASESHLMLVR